MTLPLHVATLIEMAASKNGFDRDLPPVGDWLGFASTRAPLRVWLTLRQDVDYVAAFSQHAIVSNLAGFGTPTTGPLPCGAVAARVVPGLPDLHHMLRRAFQLSRSLPDEPLQVFAHKTDKLPKTTEAERLIVQRIGQDIFRDRLLDYWASRCPLTGLAVPALLRASHIKPWAECESDGERLDVFNGLLLAPHWDAAFDRGFITLANDGAVMVTGKLSPSDRKAIGLDAPAVLPGLTDRHRAYLAWHRERVYEKEGAE